MLQIGLGYWSNSKHQILYKWQKSMEVGLASNICEKWQKSMEVALASYICEKWQKSMEVALASYIFVKVTKKYGNSPSIIYL